MRYVSLPINNTQRAFVAIRKPAFSRENGLACRLTSLASLGAGQRAPFLKIVDDDGTASSFLDALTNLKLETARALISKNFTTEVDVEELAETFEGAAACKMISTRPAHCPRNCKVKSVMVVEDGRHTVLHLRMLHEPDSSSNWKIYSVERES